LKAEKGRFGGHEDKADMSDDNKTPSDLIEEGVGLIAKGMFRRGDKSAENNPKAAYEDGMLAVGVIREMAFNFLRIANKADKSALQ
jgi:hypothetical protein